MSITNPIEKIVILSPVHPLRGGIASSTERLAGELQSLEYEVCIYSFKLQYPSLLFPGKTQYAEGPAPEGLHIREEINSINPFNWIRVGRRLARQRPDLLIVRYWIPFMAPSLGTISRIASTNGHTKVIAIADNIIPHERRPGDYLLTRYFAGSVDGFIVMSRSVEKDIRKLTKEKPVTYVPHPIYDNYGPKVDRESALNHLQLPPERRYLLFFGFVRRYKGLDLLLEAMADERLRDHHIWLIVAGEFYDDPAPYREIIRRHGLEERVFFYDTYIPKEEVKYYFGAADLVVQPYRSATQSGISQMAYHFEKPMLVTRVGGLPEIVEHNTVGYVVDVAVTAIADAIDDFFRNDRRQEMIKNVKAHKQKFSWSRMVEGIKGVFAELEEK
jgi:D-inositol-3-phosphate glycosyltransferase